MGIDANGSQSQDRYGNVGETDNDALSKLTGLSTAN